MENKPDIQRFAQEAKNLLDFSQTILGNMKGFDIDNQSVKSHIDRVQKDIAKSKQDLEDKVKEFNKTMRNS